MNINIKKENKTTTTYLDMLSSNGMQCLINESTREDVTKKTSSCMDHLFVKINESNTQAHASIIATTISDHYTLFCSLNQQVNANNKGSENNTSQQKLNNYLIDLKIKEIKWNDIINNINNTNDIYNKIHEQFADIYSSSYQTKKLHKKRSSSPWINEELVKCCLIRDKLFKKFKNNKTNKNKENEYKLYRNQLNKKIITAKNNYYRQKFIDNRNDIRATWQIINEIIGKKYTNIDDNINKNFKNNNLNNILNGFATSFSENIKQIIHDCSIQTLYNIRFTQQNSLYLSQTNEDEVYNILKCLNVKKGAGVDQIRPRDLRNNANLLTPIITKLINSSLINATVPKLLKTSIIRPIYKNGTKSDFNNYRPISILSAIEKVLEEVVVRRLTQYLEKYKIINYNQFGFQRGKSINKLLVKPLTRYHTKS
ncbi:uncharacterized protein ACRADG_004579 [Cochliomyia hominivorax]